MQAQKARTKEDWNRLFLAKNRHELLESWEWGEFKQQAGESLVRWHERGLLQGTIQRLGLGIRYASFPRCDGSALAQYLPELKKQGLTFVRIEPVESVEIKEYGSKAIKNRNPKQTQVLDLTKSNEELLGEMHSKTRYNIRLAVKKDVRIEYTKNINIFWDLYNETTNRDKFHGHTKAYLEKMLEQNFCYQVTAYYEGTPIASNICTHIGNTFTYLHGASSNKHRNVMAPYLLQWDSMQLAKKLECTRYDFWGVAKQVEEGENTQSFHNVTWSKADPWSGVTRFKAGFGGEYIEYGQAIDIIFKPFKYHLYTLLRTCIRMIKK